MAIAEMTRQALPAEEFLKELEDLRLSYLQGKTLRPRKRYAGKEDVVEAKRRKHLGGRDVTVEIHVDCRAGLAAGLHSVV